VGLCGSSPQLYTTDNNNLRIGRRTVREYLYTALICWMVAVWTATGIGCSSIMADTCEVRAVSTAMKFKICNVPHRLAVGKDHVAVQVLKDGKWKFVNIQDAKCFKTAEYMSLQRYLQYLIIYYDILDSIKSVRD